MGGERRGGEERARAGREKGGKGRVCRGPRALRRVVGEHTPQRDSHALSHPFKGVSAGLRERVKGGRIERLVNGSLRPPNSHTSFGMLCVVRV